LLLLLKGKQIHTFNSGFTAAQFILSYLSVMVEQYRTMTWNRTMTWIKKYPQRMANIHMSFYVIRYIIMLVCLSMVVTTLQAI